MKYKIGGNKRQWYCNAYKGEKGIGKGVIEERKEGRKEEGRNEAKGNGFCFCMFKIGEVS